MKAGTDDKKKLAIAAVLGVGALIYLAVTLFGGSSTPAPAPAPVTQTVTVRTPAAAPTSAPSNAVATRPTSNARAARQVGTASTQLDPTLHMEAMKAAEGLEYAGVGRNIFSMNSAPPVTIPQPVAPARPVVQQPVYTAPVGPPPPPPINLKFFGVATLNNGQRQAFLLQGEDVFLASAGDVVARRYKVQAVNATSVIVEDLPNNNQQTLPLIMQ